MSCGCCITVETPDSIKTSDNVDVFETVVSASYGSYRQICMDRLWQLYRYRMIGSCDRAFWLQCMKDRADLILPKYGTIFDAYSAADFSEMEAGGYTMVTESQSEDMPQTTADTTEYLSNRGKVTQTYTPKELADYEAVGKFGNEFYDPWTRWAYEFESLFLMDPGSCGC